MYTTRERRRVDAHLAAIRRSGDCPPACDDTVLLPRFVAYESAPLTDHDDRALVERLPWLALAVALGMLLLAATIAFAASVGDGFTPRTASGSAQLDTRDEVPEPSAHTAPATTAASAPAEPAAADAAPVRRAPAPESEPPVVRVPADPTFVPPVLVPPVAAPVDPNLTDPTLGETGDEAIGSSRCPDPLEVIVRLADGTLGCGPEAHQP